MPFCQGARAQILIQLERIQNGERVSIIEIATVTEEQHAEINFYREKFGLPVLELPRIVYLGKHHYNSRRQDGYTIEDMADQLESGLAAHSQVIATHKMTALQNKLGRADGHGNFVKDLVILELTSRKPMGEAFSAIPRGDKNKPIP